MVGRSEKTAYPGGVAEKVQHKLYSEARVAVLRIAGILRAPGQARCLSYIPPAPFRPSPYWSIPLVFTDSAGPSGGCTVYSEINEQ